MKFSVYDDEPFLGACSQKANLRNFGLNTNAELQKVLKSLDRRERRTYDRPSNDAKDGFLRAVYLRGKIGVFHTDILIVVIIALTAT
ncbi:3563_t:CDS:2, partial [Entrophospora sp. SA101]